MPGGKEDRKRIKGNVWERISKLTQIGKGKKQKADKKRGEKTERIEMKTNQDTACSLRTSTDKPNANTRLPLELMYINIENAMRLSRLEEEKNLLAALRHLVRCLHEGGRNIAFPFPEAIDRIQVRCSNIPTDPQELQRLVNLVFQRREETLN